MVYQKVFKIGFPRLCFYEFSPISTHSWMKLTIPFLASLCMNSSLQFYWNDLFWFLWCLWERLCFLCVNSLYVYYTVMADGISCLNTANFDFLLQILPPSTFVLFVVAVVFLKKASKGFCIDRFIWVLKCCFCFLNNQLIEIVYIW